MGVQVYIETNAGWLELPLTRINFHGPSLFEPLKFYCICFYGNLNVLMLLLMQIVYSMSLHYLGRFFLSDDRHYCVRLDFSECI